MEKEIILKNVLKKVFNQITADVKDFIDWYGYKTAEVKLQDMKEAIGIGINANLNKFQNNGAPLSFVGKILLQVEDKGQAYYVNPIDLSLNYLGRPEDAFNIMRNLGLGITNENLRQIEVE